MKRSFKIIVAFTFIIATCHAQWTLKLSSNVYLRKWKLDTKATKEEKEVDGATVTLFQAGKQIAQTTTSNGGEFTMMVPKDGEFYLIVSYPGCNSKRMAINTQNVPEGMQKDNYKPTFEITGGFIMVKPYPGINYNELSQDLIRVEYLPNKKAFDDTEAGTEKGLGIVSKIYASEDDLFNKFCSTNKAGDVALAKPDCPLAKQLYEKAIAMIPGEQYPVDQLAKVGLCLKDKELAEAAAKKAADDAAKKAADEAAAKLAAKEAADKKAADEAAAKTANKEKDAAAKKEADDKKAIADAVAKANADKAALIKEEEAKLAKAAKEKAAKEDAENAKLAKEKAEKDKKDKEAADRLAKQKFYEEQRAKEKSGALIVKQKSPEEIEAEAKLAKQKEGQYKSQQEDKDAMAKDAEKAKAKYEEKQKAAREKEQKQKEGMAKSKAEDEAAMKADFDKKEKARAQREADEKEKKRLAYETKSKDGQGEMDKGNSDHSLPQVLGNTQEKYKTKIKVADDYFKMKRYEEAKGAYQEALRFKANDPYATGKLADIEKLMTPK